MTNPPLKGLKARRVFRDMTEKQMAELIDVNQSQYHKLEAGTVRLDIYRAAKLAKFLDCEIGDLL